MSYSQYRLRAVPDYLHFPRVCDRHVARLLGGASDAPEAWPCGVDRRHVLDGLEWHGIGPLMYRRARDSGQLTALPDWLGDHLSRSYFRCAAQSLARERDLGLIVRQLTAQGIPVMLLKGAALARSVYPDTALRPMTDIDLLIRADRLDQARGVLAGCGLREIRSPRRPDREHHVRLTGSGSGGSALRLELHWRLSDKRPLEARMPCEDLWERSVPACPPLQQARMPEAGDALLHAAMHLAEHNGLAQLRWLADVDRLVRRLTQPDGAWPVVAARAIRYNLQLVLAAALQEAERWFGTAVPNRTWQLLAAGLPPGEAACAVYARCSCSGVIGLELENLGAMATFRDRLEHLRRAIFPGRAFIQRRHRLGEDSAVWPYAIQRLGRGLRDGARFMLYRGGERLRPSETGQKKERP